MYSAQCLVPLKNIHYGSRCIAPSLFLNFSLQCIQGEAFEVPLSCRAGPDDDVRARVHATRQIKYLFPSVCFIDASYSNAPLAISRMNNRTVVASVDAVDFSESLNVIHYVLLELVFVRFNFEESRASRKAAANTPDINLFEARAEGDSVGCVIDGINVFDTVTKYCRR